MDKSKLRSGLFELLRDHLPSFERAARITCMLSVRLDGSDEAAVFVDIVEELPAKLADADRPPPPVAVKVEKSKRKSQAPQKMVPASSVEDSFEPVSSAAASCGQASSSFLNGSVDTATTSLEQQAVNLSRGGGGDSQQLQPVTSSTPVKKAAGAIGFYVNNPSGFQQHFLLPHHQLSGVQFAASVFPTPTAVFQAAAPVAPSASAKTPPPAAVHAAEEAAAGLPKLPILPAAGQNPHQRPRSLFGLRSRRGGHKSFPCNQCHETFGSLASLSKHTYSMHKGYKCTFCSANFTQRSNLQRHSLKHVGFKPFACRCCQKSYYRKDHLVRHIEVTHPGKEPKKNIETKLSSAECLEYLERKYESGEYSIALDEADADADDDMPDEAEAGVARPDGDDEMLDAEADDGTDDEEADDEGDEEVGEAVVEKAVAVEEPPQPQPQRRQLRRHGAASEHPSMPAEATA